MENCGLNLGMPVVVGVSGGPDSICLLAVLHQLRVPLIAAHFNHQLRPDSDADEARVREFAGRLGIPFVAERADVGAWATQEGLSIEEAARVLRYPFLFRQARRFGAQAVATGHTADDQVETVLMHLLQGSGLAGLAGMPFRGVLAQWDAEIPLVRPLLGAWRAEILAYCQEQSLPFGIDFTNLDPAYTRNRVRLQLIPELETYNPKVRQALWRMSQAAASDGEIVRLAVQSAWLACLAEARPEFVALWLAPLRAQPVPLQRALLRYAAAELLKSRPGALRAVGFEDVERALSFLQVPSASGKLNLAQGLHLAIEPGAGGKDRLLILPWELAETLLPGEAVPQLQPGFEQAVPVPGRMDLGQGWVLRSEWMEPGPGSWTPDWQSVGRWDAYLNESTITARLAVRPAQPGARFEPLGMQGRTVKLSDFWVNEKLPRRLRAHWPVVYAGDAVAWIPGFRLAHPFQVTGQPRRVLHLWLSRT